MNESIRVSIGIMTILLISYLIFENYSVRSAHIDQIEYLLETNRTLSDSLQKAKTSNIECLNSISLLTGRLIQHTGEYELAKLEEMVERYNISVCKYDNILKRVK